jgi:plasmid stability protein
MRQLLIRDVEDEVVAALKERAKHNQRSLQGELKLIVTQAAVVSRMNPALLARIDMLRNKLKGRKHTDSVKLLREIRGR